MLSALVPSIPKQLLRLSFFLLSIMLSACGGESGSSSSAGSESSLSHYTIGTEVVGSGLLTPNVDQIVDAGSQVTFKLTPDEGYRIGSVTGCDGQLDVNSYTFSANSDCTLKVSFLRFFTLKNQGFSGSVRSVALSKDGSDDIYVGGEFSSYNNFKSKGIIRLNKDGSIDKSFNIGSGFDNPITKILPLSDGSGDIYVVAEQRSTLAYYNGTPLTQKTYHMDSLVRLRSDGSFVSAVDWSPIEGTAYINDVQETSNGSIYVIGDFTMHLGGSNRKGVIRLNKNGVIDSSFDIEKALSYSDTSSLSTANDGTEDIYIAGVASTSTIPYAATNALLRLKKDGSLDDKFTPFYFYGYSPKISITNDGSGDIYLSRNESQRIMLSRHKRDGSINTNFPKIAFSGQSRITSFILPVADGTGDILIGLEEDGGSNTTDSYYRIQADGNILYSYNMGIGKSLYSAILKPGNSDEIYLAGNFDHFNETKTNNLVKISGTGEVSQTFSDNQSFSGENIDSFPVILTTTQNNQKPEALYVAGRFDRYNGKITNNISALNNEGELLSTLKIENDLDSIKGLLASPLGWVYVFGAKFDGIHANGVHSLMRYNQFGQKDTSFSPLKNQKYFIEEIANVLNADHQLYLMGYFKSDNAVNSTELIRIDSNGVVDPSFNLERIPNDAKISHITSSKIDNGIYISTANHYMSDNTYKSYNIKVSKIDKNGVKDATFIPEYTFNGIINTMASDKIGHLYVGGKFSNYNEIQVGHLARFTPDGQLDIKFNSGEGFDNDVSVLMLANDSSGDIYVGGKFKSFNNIISPYLVRLNSDGTIDSEFNIGSGFDGEIDSISSANDGTHDIYVSGKFSSYNGVTAKKVIRLSPEGAIH